MPSVAREELLTDRLWQRPETELLGETLANIPQRVRRPAYADRADDSDPLRLRGYQRRWIVERSIAWLPNFRRVAARHAYYSFIFTGFVQLACALIAVSRF
jgi:transposase